MSNNQMYEILIDKLRELKKNESLLVEKKELLEQNENKIRESNYEHDELDTKSDEISSDIIKEVENYIAKKNVLSALKIWLFSPVIGISLFLLLSELVGLIWVLLTLLISFKKMESDKNKEEMLYYSMLEKKLSEHSEYQRILELLDVNDKEFKALLDSVVNTKDEISLIEGNIEKLKMELYFMISEDDTVEVCEDELEKQSVKARARNILDEIK